MKMLFIVLPALLTAWSAAAQTVSPGMPEATGFYDRGSGVTYALKSVEVAGEVEDPGPVDLSKLPLRQIPLKWISNESGAFSGAYLVTGWSLYDILSAKKLKKARSDFKPETDLFVTVENAAGEKAVVSWGEIFYSADGYGIMVSQGFRSVTAPKRKTDWPLPNEPRLVCPRDLHDGRFINKPVRITVRSAPGEFPGEKHAAAYAPSFTVVRGGKSAEIKDPGEIRKRSFTAAGYGHGTGFKGIKEGEGYLLKDLLAGTGLLPSDAFGWLAVVSAGDSYRAVFSLSELIDRGDNGDALLLDKGKSEDGRFSLFLPADFFVDRNVRSMAKVELLKI